MRTARTVERQTGVVCGITSAMRQDSTIVELPNMLTSNGVVDGLKSSMNRTAPMLLSACMEHTEGCYVGEVS